MKIKIVGYIIYKCIVEALKNLKLNVEVEIELLNEVIIIPLLLSIASKLLITTTLVLNVRLQEFVWRTISTS